MDNIQQISQLFEHVLTSPFVGDVFTNLLIRFIKFSILFSDQILLQIQRGRRQIRRQLVRFAKFFRAVFVIRHAR